MPDISKWTEGSWPMIAEAIGGHSLGVAVGLATGVGEVELSRRGDAHGDAFERAALSVDDGAVEGLAVFGADAVRGSHRRDPG